MKKKCSKCLKEKDISCFRVYKEKRVKSGYQVRPACKECESINRKVKYIKNRQHYLTVAKKSYHKNKVEINTKQRERRANNRDAFIEQSRKYYKKHAEKRRRYSREYNRKHRGKVREKWKEYYDKNKDELYQKNRKWVKDNPEKMKKYFRGVVLRVGDSYARTILKNQGWPEGVLIPELLDIKRKLLIEKRKIKNNEKEVQKTKKSK